MERLSSFDTSFLANERGGAHMAIGAVLVCEGPPPTEEEFLAHLSSRLHRVPRLRKRLVFPPLRFGTPFWVDDPHFDVHRHLHRLTAPAPGSAGELRELLGELLAPPLDRARPLWELTLIDGLEDDRFAILYRTHHSMADGISAVDIGMLLFDTEPDAPAGPEPPAWRPEPVPNGRHLLTHAALAVPASVLRSARWLRSALRAPARALKRMTDGLAGLGEVAWNLARPAPRVSFNRPIGSRRSFAWIDFDLAEFKAVKNASGGTVNDVCLAVATGALRSWMAERGELPDAPELKALVPVSIRAENEHGELGNKLTAMRGPLPIALADPAARLQRVRVAMEDLKASKQSLGAEAIWGLNDWFRDFAPPILLRPTAAINFSTRLFNLLLTNFPGPQIPFYVLGRRLTEIYPLGFLARNHGLAIAILSYDGKIAFGLLADPEVVPDLDRLAEHIKSAAAELAEPLPSTVS